MKTKKPPDKLSPEMIERVTFRLTKRGGTTLREASADLFNRHIESGPEAERATAYHNVVVVEMTPDDEIKNQKEMTAKRRELNAILKEKTASAADFREAAMSAFAQLICDYLAAEYGPARFDKDERLIGFGADVVVDPKTAHASLVAGTSNWNGHIKRPGKIK